MARAPAQWLDPSTVGMRPEWRATARSGRGSGLDLALFSGGDERVVLDPGTGRTKYGTPRECAEGEIWFSSSTASAVTARGYAAAARGWQRLVSGDETLENCFDSIRQRLTQFFGIEGTQAVLAGSGTEVVLISLALARLVCSPHITTIIVGCAETGRGVSAAAAGLHFLRHAAFAEVVPGDRLAGFDGLDINVDTIALRDRSGVLRATAEIDAELTRKVEAGRRNGRDVIIHRLDVSKTGHSAPSLAAITRLCEEAPGHVFVLADCCQLRCSPAHIKGLLQRGFLVSMTGSKFAGGPPFAGALLVPPAILQRLQPMPLPAGFSAYSAQLDWPPVFRAVLRLDMLPAANIGLALRWQAALAEIERFFAWPVALRDAIITRFVEEVVQQAADAPCLDLLTMPAESEAHWGRTILCFAMRHPDGKVLDLAEAAAVLRRLQEGKHPGNGGAARRFHLGQPVAVGGAGVLRVCASAALINRVAENIDAGMTLAEAFAPLAKDIGDLFLAWPAAVAACAQAGTKQDSL